MALSPRVRRPIEERVLEIDIREFEEFVVAYKAAKRVYDALVMIHRSLDGAEFAPIHYRAPGGAGSTRMCLGSGKCVEVSRSPGGVDILVGGAASIRLEVSGAGGGVISISPYRIVLIGRLLKRLGIDPSELAAAAAEESARCGGGCAASAVEALSAASALSLVCAEAVRRAIGGIDPGVFLGEILDEVREEASKAVEAVASAKEAAARGSSGEVLQRLAEGRPPLTLLIAEYSYRGKRRVGGQRLLGQALEDLRKQVVETASLRAVLETALVLADE